MPLKSTAQAPPTPIDDYPYYYSAVPSGNEYLDDLINCYWLKYQNRDDWFKYKRNAILLALTKDERWFPPEEQMKEYRKEMEIG